MAKLSHKGTYTSLIVGVLKKAAEDAKKRDPLVSLDARLFLLEDGQLWAEAVGVELGPYGFLTWLTQLDRGGRYGPSNETG